MAKTRIKKESPLDHITLTNDLSIDLAQYDFAVVAGFAAVADEDIADTADGSFAIAEGLQVQADDLKATEDTFATQGQVVYWDQSTEEFSDTSTVGYFAVGILTQVKDAAGVIVFDKYRYAVLV